MVKLSLVLAVLAASVAGWLAWERQAILDDLALLREEQQASGARLLSIERGVAALQARAPEGAMLTAVAPPAADSPGGASVSASGANTGPGLVGATRPPVSVEQRVAELERQLATARSAPAAAPAPVATPQIYMSPRGWLGSLDQAEKELKLDASQKSNLERVIDDVERELDALSTRPNGDGKTLKQLQEEFKPEGFMGEEGMAKMHEHLAAVSRFRQSKVPGTNETYAEAERRVRKEGKARARSFLSPEQAKTWDKSHTDMLFGRGGGGMAGAFVSMDAAPIEITLPAVR